MKSATWLMWLMREFVGGGLTDIEIRQNISRLEKRRQFHRDKALDLSAEINHWRTELTKNRGTNEQHRAV